MKMSAETTIDLPIDVLQPTNPYLLGEHLGKERPLVPVEVLTAGTHHILIDGHHRIYDAVREGRTTVPVHIRNPMYYDQWADLNGGRDAAYFQRLAKQCFRNGITSIRDYHNMEHFQF